MARPRRYTRKKPGFFDALIPEAVQAFIANRLVDGFGLVLLLGGLGLLLSMISYNAADPSWNTAGAGGNEHLHNWMGMPGAYMADLLLQTVGLAGVLFGVIMGFWGFRIVRRQKIAPLPVRVTLMIFTTLTASIAFASIPSAGWLLHPWLGAAAGH